MVTYKQIKCHKCYGAGCVYCDFSGIVSKSKGNKKLIDKYYEGLRLK
jgi:hypothetical protein